jgi:hypothetical protein
MKKKFFITPFLLIIIFILVGAGAVVASLLIGGGGGTEEVSLQKGLVGWWKFDGNAKDSSANSNHGTVTGATLATDRKGQTDKAYSFNGTSNYIDLGTTSFIYRNQPFTVTAWVRQSSFIDPYPVIFATRYDGHSDDVWGLHFSNNSSYRYVTFGAGGSWAGNRYEGMGDPSGDWHNIVVTYNGSGAGTASNFKLYFDGSLQTLTSTASFSWENDDSMIGSLRPSRTDSDFNGSIDDVRVYNRALSQTEATALYNEYNSGIVISDLQKGLVGNWKMDGNAKDSSANSNHGIVSGATLATDRKGQNNKAYSFNGTTAHILEGNVGSSIKTISFWMQANTTASKKIINVDGTKQIELNGSSNVVATSFPTATVYIDGSSASANIPDTNWHFVTVTDTSGVSASTFDIGAVSASYFNGKIDDVRVYNRVLSATEITSLYQEYDSGIAISDLQKGLMGNWKMDGNAKDSSANSNHGTVTGATLTTDRKGQNNKAYSFDGASNFLSSAYSNVFDFGTNSFTVSTWFKQQPITATTVDKQVGAGADDGHRYVGGSGEFATNTNDSVGYFNSTAMNTFHRFTGVTMSGNIDVAYIQIWSRALDHTPGYIAHVILEDNAVAPTTAEEFDADPLSTGVAWNGPFTNSSWNTSPELKTEFQSLIDSFTIANDAVMVQIKDNVGTESNYITVGNYEWSSTNGVKLHVEYSSPAYLISRYNGAGWKTYINGASGNVCFGIDDDSTWGPDDKICSTGGNYDDNAWHQVSIAKDGTTGIYLYVDGVLAGSNTSLTATGSLSGTTPALYNGIDSDGSSSPLKGSMDDVRIYSRALSAAEVKTLYDSY